MFIIVFSLAKRLYSYYMLVSFCMPVSLFVFAGKPKYSHLYKCTLEGNDR